MPLNFHQSTLETYLDQLSRREPVPGGGSAAAFTAAMGAGLISMVTNYSIRRKVNTPAVDAKLKKSLEKSEAIRRRLLELTSLDSEAYLQIVEARSKDVSAQKKASRQAAQVGKEVCRLCYKSMELAPYLVEHGNPYLISDIEAAIELLHAGFNASMVMVRINQ